MHLINFCVEVTRRCNLSCEHCIRGDAQNLDIKNEYIYEFLKKNDITSIGDILFTGGEPTLNTSAIKYTLEVCKQLDISVDSFNIVINAMKENKEFLDIISSWYDYVKSPKYGCISISYNNKFYKRQDKKWIKTLRKLPYVTTRHILSNQILGEGKGIEYNKKNGYYLNTINIFETNNKIFGSKVYSPLDIIDMYQSDIYLNVLGDIVLNCFSSYESQEKIKIGNVMEYTLIEMIDIKKNEYMQKECVVNHRELQLV